jgi:hypothetical protein
MANMNVILELLDGASAGTCYKISSNAAVIGRSPEADIAFPDEKSLSRKHCEILVKDEKVFVRDLESQNGTFLNETKITEAFAGNGVVLKAGRVRFKIIIADSQMLQKAAMQNTAALGRSDNTGGLATADTNNSPAYETGFYSYEESSSPNKFAWKAMLFIALIVCGLYGINALSKNTRRDKVPHHILKRNGNLVLRLPASAKGYSERNIKIISSTDEPVVDWKKFKGLIGKKYTENVIVLHGRTQGDAVFSVSMNGNEVFKCEIHVRGVIPREWDDAMMDTAAYLRLANKKAEEAEILKSSQPYEAMIRMEQAAELYLKAGEGTRSEKIEFQRDDIKRMLHKRVQTLYEDARFLLKGQAGINRDPAGALVKLEEIKRLIPDEESIDWQLANNVQEIARRQIR